PDPVADLLLDFLEFGPILSVPFHPSIVALSRLASSLCRFRNAPRCQIFREKLPRFWRHFPAFRASRHASMRHFELQKACIGEALRTNEVPHQAQLPRRILASRSGPMFFRVKVCDWLSANTVSNIIVREFVAGIRAGVPL